MMQYLHFFCRKCLKNHCVFVNYNLQFNNLDPRLKPDTNIHFDYECDCGYIAEEIDPLLIESISKLNNLGFYTDYCCEGHYHYENDSIDWPYIKFLSTKYKYADDIHILDKKKEKYLKKFLKKNLNYPLIYKYDFKWNHSLSIEIDDKSINDNDALSNSSYFNEIKEMAIHEIIRIVNLLEEEVKKKGI